MFLHAGVIHFLFNMIGFLQVGGMVERVFGWWRVSLLEACVPQAYKRVLVVLPTPPGFGIRGVFRFGVLVGWLLLLDLVATFSFLFSFLFFFYVC